MYAMGGEECYRSESDLLAHEPLAHDDLLVGARVSLLGVDVARLKQLEERIVQQPHSQLAARLHDAGEHERFAVANARRHRFRPEQDLEGEHASSAVLPRDELLRNDSPEGL